MSRFSKEKPTYEELVEALEGMCLQYLDWEGVFDHSFMCAGEHALDVLHRFSKVETKDEVTYTWVSGHENHPKSL